MAQGFNLAREENYFVCNSFIVAASSGNPTLESSRGPFRLGQRENVSAVAGKCLVGIQHHVWRFSW
jgi:hypothetical protein